MTYNSLPIVIGAKGKPVDWEPLKQRMQAALGYVPSLSQKLSSPELDKLGFRAASAYDIR